MIFSFILQFYSILCTTNVVVKNITGGCRVYSKKYGLLFSLNPDKELIISYSSSAKTNFVYDSHINKKEPTLGLNFDYKSYFKNNESKSGSDSDEESTFESWSSDEVNDYNDSYTENDELPLELDSDEESIFDYKSYFKNDELPLELDSDEESIFDILSSAKTNIHSDKFSAKLTISDAQGKIYIEECWEEYSRNTEIHESSVLLVFEFDENTSISINSDSLEIIEHDFDIEECENANLITDDDTLLPMTSMSEENLEYIFNIEKCENVESITSGDTLLPITSMSELKCGNVEFTENNSPFKILKKGENILIKVLGNKINLEQIETDKLLFNNELSFKFKEKSDVTFEFKKNK